MKKASPPAPDMVSLASKTPKAFRQLALCSQVLGWRSHSRSGVHGTNPKTLKIASSGQGTPALLTVVNKNRHAIQPLTAISTLCGASKTGKTICHRERQSLSKRILVLPGGYRTLISTHGRNSAGSSLACPRYRVPSAPILLASYAPRVFWNLLRT